MSEIDQRDIKELLRDIHEDLRGDENRNIPGLINKVNVVKQRQEEMDKRLRDVEHFIYLVTSAPRKAKIFVYIVGGILGIAISIAVLWGHVTKIFK